MSIRKFSLLFLPGLTGILAFASFPKAGQAYLAWIALVPLLVFLYEVRSLKGVFWGGFLAGVVEFLALLPWIPPVMLHYGGLSAPTAWLLYVLLAAMLALFPALAALGTRWAMNRRGEAGLLVFPFLWVALEYARNFVPFGGFPWLLYGYSQTDHLTLAQAADITGVYGVSFLLVWANTAVAILFLRKGTLRSRSWPAAAGIVLTAAFMLYGRSALIRWGNVEAPYKAAMLQGDLSFDEPQQDLAWKYRQGYVEMAGRISGKADLLLLPESPSPLIYQYDSDYRKTMDELARRFTFGIVFNNIAYGEEDGTEGYFNSAYFLDRDGRSLGRYDKMHLVPFGEYIPLKKLFFFAETITKDVGGFQAGRRVLTVPLGSHRAGAVICFEAVFPDLVRKFAAGGELLINLTNDRWYGDTAAPYQHFAMARWRAIENRRFLLRAANSGISSIVEPTGRTEFRTPILRREIALGSFGFVSYETFYTRYGDVFAAGCVIILCCLMIWTYWSGRRRGEPPGPGFRR